MRLQGLELGQAPEALGTERCYGSVNPQGGKHQIHLPDRPAQRTPDADHAVQAIQHFCINPLDPNLRWIAFRHRLQVEGFPPMDKGRGQEGLQLNEAKTGLLKNNGDALKQPLAAAIQGQSHPLSIAVGVEDTPGGIAGWPQPPGAPEVIPGSAREDGFRFAFG